VTRARAEDLIERLKAGRNRALRSTGMGRYRVLLNRSATTHMDFSDLPVLGAQDDVEAEMRECVLAIVGNYTRAFFDKYVRGMESPLLEGKATDQLIEAVQIFGPAKRCPAPRRLRHNIKI
jgi:hypothetical protein